MGAGLSLLFASKKGEKKKKEEGDYAKEFIPSKATAVERRCTRDYVLAEVEKEKGEKHGVAAACHPTLSLKSFWGRKKEKKRHRSTSEGN